MFIDIRENKPPAIISFDSGTLEAQLGQILASCWVSQPSERPLAINLISTLSSIIDSALMQQKQAPGAPIDDKIGTRPHLKDLNLQEQVKNSDSPAIFLTASPLTETTPDISLDLAQSDEGDPSSHVSASIPSRHEDMPSSSRQNRYWVPTDIFTNPPDPVRHQLYHQIRQEPWFSQQRVERGLTPAESKEIPESKPGESVVLAFFDRVRDENNRAVMRCTIYNQTGSSTHLYRQAESAKIHMRRHLQLCPMACHGLCRTKQWYASTFPFLFYINEVLPY
jgi:hypothetical protein